MAGRFQEPNLDTSGVCSERPVCGMVWTMSANEVLEQEDLV
jgi:hypothetical protein